MEFIKTTNFIQQISAQGTPTFSESIVTVGTENTLITLTIPKETFILGVFCSGQVDGIFTILVDGFTMLKGRVHGGNLNCFFNLDGKIKLVTGQVLEIKVKNIYKVDGNFSTTLITRSL